MKKNISVGSIVKDHPHMMDVFNDLGVDYCCGGKDSLEVVAQKKNYDLDSFLRLVDKEVAKKPQETSRQMDLKDFEKLSLKDMLDSLEATHHADELRLMAAVEEDLNRILWAHYQNHKDLLLFLHKNFGLLKLELEAHFAQEERETFPLMRQKKDQETLDKVAILEEEHTQAGEIIQEILDRTDNLTLPEDVCVTFERTYQELRDLFEDIFIHIYKENSILFPVYEKEVLG
ncbi:MAG: DUF542 domain-containing protein [Tissierellia bacterium]|nr:DUF542 domain-containing protein [Tissierellia bacterium]